MELGKFRYVLIHRRPNTHGFVLAYGSYVDAAYRQLILAQSEKRAQAG